MDYTITRRLSHGVSKMEISDSRKELIGELYDLSKRFFSSERPKDSIGYGQGQKRILLYLYEHPEGATPGELASHLKVGTGRISNVLKDFEKRDIISRSADKEDLRRKKVTITEDGKKLFLESRALFLERTNALIDYVGEKKFKSYLQSFSEFLCAVDHVKSSVSTKGA